MCPALFFLLLVQTGLVCGQSDMTYIFWFVEEKNSFFIPRLSHTLFGDGVWSLGINIEE